MRIGAARRVAGDSEVTGGGDGGEFVERERVRLRVVTLISGAMMLVLLVTLFGVLSFIFVYPDREIPSLLRDIFFGTLGYFGGALVSFLKIR